MAVRYLAKPEHPDLLSIALDMKVTLHLSAVLHHRRCFALVFGMDLGENLETTGAPRF